MSSSCLSASAIGDGFTGSDNPPRLYCVPVTRRIMSVAALEARKKDVHVLSRYKEGNKMMVFSYCWRGGNRL